MALDGSNELGILLDDADKAKAAGTPAGEGLRLFHRICVLRADGPLLVGNRNAFAEINELFCDVNDQQARDLDTELWSALLDIELDQAMHAVLLREDFFEENITAIAPFIHILASVIERYKTLSYGSGRERESAALRRVSARVTTFSDHLWENRQRISYLWAPITDPECHILPLITVYMHCAEVAQKPPPLSLLNMFLSIWASFSEQLSPSTMDPAFQLHAKVFFTGDDTENAGKIRAAVIDTIGPDVWFKHVLRDVQLANISCRYRGTLLQVLNSIGLHPLMVSHFEKHHCLDVIATVLEKAGLDPDNEARAWVCNSASWVVHRCVSQYFYNARLVAPKVVVDGSLPVSALSRELHYIVIDDCPLFGQQESQLLHELIRQYTDIVRVPDRRSYVQRFMTQIKISMRNEWWPTLARLQATYYRHREDRILASLVQSWSEFGIACGMDEEKERRRYRREGRAFCSWTACEYSLQKPPGKLLSCRACGEAQYCGRECQRKDWNQGGHKKRCGNRLKA